MIFFTSDSAGRETVQTKPNTKANWLPLILFFMLVGFSCGPKPKNDMHVTKKIDKYVHFSDSLNKDHFVVSLVDKADKQEALTIEIRDFKDSLLFKNTWPLRNWVSVANKINNLYSDEQRAHRVAAIFDESLANGKFGQMRDFLITRIVDDPQGTLKNEYNSTDWRPVYSLFYADAVLVYSKSLNRVVEINAMSKPLLEKYSIRY